MFEYFYHEILRRTIIAFGTLFNSIEIQHSDSSDDTKSIIRVPLAYGPTQKFLARLEQSADLSKGTQMSLPRMSFEFTGLTYDPTRKLTTTQRFISKTVGIGSEVRKAYMPVPYNMQFELSIYTKLNDDMLQIVEQILPYFQPQYNLTVNLVETIGEKRDIPVVLENITMVDDYEGDYTSRRAMYYTLRFTAKTYLFGPVQSASESSKDIIKSVRIGYVEGSTTKTPTRDITYAVTPRATKPYGTDAETLLSGDVGTKNTRISVDDASNIAEHSYFLINNESFFVESKSGNSLKVRRAQDGTSVQDHVSGSEVFIVTQAMDDLIEPGDDFGFDGSIL